MDREDSRLGELEAVLFASPRPLSAAALARRLERPEAEIAALLARYAEDLTAPSRGLQLREARGLWSLATKLAHEDVVRAARQERGQLPLTAAALETLAAVALRQPIATREVNRERGRDSLAALHTLAQRGLIARSPQPDRAPGLWRTTGRFLEVCGIPNIAALHQDGEFERVFQSLRETGKPEEQLEPDDRSDALTSAT